MDDPALPAPSGGATREGGVGGLRETWYDESRQVGEGSIAAASEPPPRDRLGKPCQEGRGYSRQYHKWSWTKARKGARVEFESGEWHHTWLAHELRRHWAITSVEPWRSKLKNTEPEDHESDTNYYCWLLDPVAPASGGSDTSCWAALFGCSNYEDMGAAYK